jgi:predicted dehydrogenase
MHVSHMRGPVFHQAFGELSEALQVARPRAVVLCTPPDMHIPQALLALQHGCHVLTEKPLSDGLSGVAELIAARDAAKRVVMVALCFRFHAGAVRARELLQQGVIGELVGCRGMMGEPFPLIRPDDYRTMFTGRKGGTGAFDLIHDIDLACWVSCAQVRANS